MNDSPFAQLNMKQAKRLLRAMSDLARESSLTGSLEDGSGAAVRQYNGLINHLSENGAVPRGLFTQLDEEEAGFDELGVACILLNAFLDEDDAVPPAPPAPPNMAVAHPDSEELRELRELRDLLRERMPAK